MTTARNFEDIPVWKEARKLTKQIYYSAKMKPFCFDKGLVDQITRASVSVMSNIAEGIERGTTKELIYFLFIAKGSAGEVRCQLYVAEDQSYIAPDKAEELRYSARQISCQLNNWIKSLQSTDVSRGPQYNKQKSKSDKLYEDGREWLEQRLIKLEKERRNRKEEEECSANRK